jgi:hypothetical protein
MRRLSLVLGLVPLLGLAELALHRYLVARPPQFADYAALAPALLKLKQPGVPVVVAPSWAEPFVRQAAAAAFPLAELTRPDDSGFIGFLEVSLLGAHAPELERFPLTKSEQFGKFQLSWRQNPKPDPVLFDFVSAVDRGEVEIFAELEGVRRPCAVTQRARTSTGGLHGHVAYPRARHECPGGRIVAVTLSEDQAYRPHRCVLTQLPDAGRIVLRFSSAPATARLVGFTGFSYFLERDAQADEVELTVSEGSEPLGERRAAGARGWSRFELPRGGTPGAIEVSLRRLVHSAGDFCFALEAR